MNSKCWICQVDILNDNKTVEHILINACGGRLKSTELICRKCNNTAGDECDSELANQLKFFSTLFNVKRDRGKPSPIKKVKDKNGNYYDLAPGKIVKPSLSKREFKKTIIDDKRTQINIVARNIEELQKMLSEVKNKYPSFDLENSSNLIKETNEYIQEPLNYSTQIGGYLAFKSICKTAINYYLYKGYKVDFIKNIIDKYTSNYKPLGVFLFYPDLDVYKRDDNEVSHVIHLKGENKSSSLIAYIELFNSHCYLVNLNDNYKGPEIHSTYIYDVIQQKEIVKKNVQINQDTLHFTELDNSKVNISRIIFKQSEISTKAQFLQNQNKVSDIVQTSIEKVLGKYDENTLLNEEHIKSVTNEIVNEYIKWMGPRLLK